MIRAGRQSGTPDSPVHHRAMPCGSVQIERNEKASASLADQDDDDATAKVEAEQPEKYKHII